VAISGKSAGAPHRKNKRNPLPPAATACVAKYMVRRGMKKGLPRSHAPRVLARRREAPAMLYAGLDLSRKRLDFHLLDAEGATVEVGAAAPDADGLHRLTCRLDR